MSKRKKQKFNPFVDEINPFVEEITHNLMYEGHFPFKKKKGEKDGKLSFSSISNNAINKLSSVEKQQAKLISSEVGKLAKKGDIRSITFLTHDGRHEVYEGGFNDFTKEMVIRGKKSRNNPEPIRTLTHEGLHAIDFNRIHLDQKLKLTLDKVTPKNIKGNNLFIEWYNDIQRIINNPEFSWYYPSGENNILSEGLKPLKEQKNWMKNLFEKKEYKDIFGEIAAYSFAQLDKDFDVSDINNKNAGRKILKKVLKEIQNDFIDNVEGFNGSGKNENKYSDLEKAFNDRIFQLKNNRSAFDQFESEEKFNGMPEERFFRYAEKKRLNTPETYFDYRQKRRFEKLAESTSIIGPGVHAPAVSTNDVDLLSPKYQLTAMSGDNQSTLSEMQKPHHHGGDNPESPKP